MPKTKLKTKPKSTSLFVPFLFTILFIIATFATLFYLQNYSVTGVDSTAAPQQLVNAGSDAKFVPGEVLVKLKDPIEDLDRENLEKPGIKGSKKTPEEILSSKLPAKILEVHKKYKIKSIEKTIPTAKSRGKNANKRASEEEILSEDNLAKIYTLSFAENSAVDKVINDLTGDPSIEYAEPNYIVEPALTPNDPLFPLNSAAFNQWGLENHGRPASSIFRVDSDIDALDAWNASRGDPSVVIAVIDSGVDYTHPDLGGGIGPTKKVLMGYDFVNLDTNPMDDYGHGTHVAGIIAAFGNNGTGVIGVCPGCKLIAAKVFNSDGGGGYTTRIADAIKYSVNNGADIINLSLGTYVASDTMRYAVDYATSRSRHVVAAAGNDNKSTPFYPAAFNKVIAVANTDYKDIKAEKSNYDNGTGWVDISAPGTFILSTSLTGGKVCVYPHESKIARYAYCSGTSMAAPMVAGVVGLMMSSYPATRYDVLEQILLTRADNIDAYNPSYIGKLGKGRVNARRALTEGNLYCSDSDWGSNLAVKGLTTSNSANCSISGKGWDSCVDAKTLLERTCGASFSCIRTTHVCPGKCVDGACVN